MELRQCPNGHFYDPQKYASCPTCSESSETTPIGGTIPLDIGGGFEPISPTEPLDPVEDPVPAPAPLAQEAEDHNVTTPYDEANLGFVPTVGWVVCIRGPHKGTDFRLVTGYNKIGRSSKNTICLPDDEGVTRDAHANIIYEPIEKKFYAVGENNMIYLNGAFINDMRELKANDIIKVGTGATELLFIPLCSESFSWD